jgi:hypothetical protein
LDLLFERWIQENAWSANELVDRSESELDDRKSNTELSLVVRTKNRYRLEGCGAVRRSVS